jgi:hypothetical protein
MPAMTHLKIQLTHNMYTNIPIEKPTSSSDSTLKTFNTYNSRPTELNNNTLIAMKGILETRGFNTDTSENIAIAVLEQAKSDGYNPMVILETVRGLGQAELSALVAEILNNNRFKTSNLGVIQTVIPVENVQRNILP